MASRMRQVQEVKRLNERELEKCISLKESWHWTYKGCAWVYVGGFPYKLTEGDLICIFSQFGEIEDIHLVREEATGKSLGFAFIKYEDWKSTILAVDNMNGVEILGRTISVDHKKEYSPPKPKKDKTKQQQDQEMPVEHVPGHAYKDKELANEYDINKGIDVFRPQEDDEEEEEEEEEDQDHGAKRKSSKDRKKKKKKKHDKRKKKTSKQRSPSREETKHGNDDNNGHDVSKERNGGKRRAERPKSDNDRSAKSRRTEQGSTQSGNASWRGRREPACTVPSWRGRREPGT